MNNKPQTNKVPLGFKIFASIGLWSLALLGLTGLVDIFLHRYDETLRVLYIVFMYLFAIGLLGSAVVVKLEN